MEGGGKKGERKIVDLNSPAEASGIKYMLFFCSCTR